MGSVASRTMAHTGFHNARFHQGLLPHTPLRPRPAVLDNGVVDEIHQRLDRLNATRPPVKASSGFQCPKVRFGRTELQMPIITCGGMRLQQSWNRAGAQTVLKMEEVDPSCQGNLIAIIRQALAYGINHFETAQGYGCSELQFGAAFKSLLESGEVKREDVIIQTKVGPQKTAALFREKLKLSFTRLDLDSIGYIDLFAFHGINRDVHLDYVVNNVEAGNCMDVINEYRAAGKVRHVGFSTHAMTQTIINAINTGQFDYVNLHYQFIGSYTASGCAPVGGNLAAVEAAAAHDMGVFVISGADKGGKLYKPSTKLARLCAPLDPIGFNSLWLWNHGPVVHTIVVGAARPTDFDASMQAARLYGTEEGRSSAQAAEARLKAAAVEALGDDWLENWWRGLPHCYETDSGVHVCKIVWLHGLIKAWGMHEYAIDRYGVMDGNAKAWDNAKSSEENRKDWGYMPGCAYRPDVDLISELSGSKDAERAMACLREAHVWLSNTGIQKVPDALTADCAAAYDLQKGDTPWPDRK